MICAGIDYSMTSPAITIHDGNTWNISNCKFYYLVPKEKQLVESKIYKGTVYPIYSSDMQRFDNLATWVFDILDKNLVEKVFIEAYAYGASGRLFEIGENTGILKHMLWKRGSRYEVFPPTMVKKFATGKGNSNKTKMEEAFFSETGINIKQELNTKKENPSSDIIDSYYIAKMGFFGLQTIDNVIL